MLPAVNWRIERNNESKGRIDLRLEPNSSLHYLPLIHYVKQLEVLTETECEEFASYFTEKRVKKRQFIVQPDFPTKHRYFVVKGAFRSFVVGDNGNEHTISVAIENWCITDYNSYIYRQTASMFVVAM